MVRFDEGNYLLKEWTFEKGMEELLYQLKNDDVIGKMWAASELVKFEGNSLVAVELTDRMQNDPFWAVRRSALEVLSKVDAKMNIELLKKMCRDKNSKVRTTAIQILGDRRDPDLLPFFKDQFKTDDSYIAQSETIHAIGKCGDRSQITYLEDLAKMKSPRNVIKEAVDWALKELMKEKQQKAGQGG